MAGTAPSSCGFASQCSSFVFNGWPIYYTTVIIMTESSFTITAIVGAIIGSIALVVLITVFIVVSVAIVKQKKRKVVISNKYVTC